MSVPVLILPSLRITGDPLGDSPRTLRLGSASESDFTNPWNPATAADDVRSKLIEYFGQSGVVAGTPQAQGIMAKYFNRTSEDSAQAASVGVFMADSGTPYTQTLPVTGWEADAVVQGANVASKVVGFAAVAEAQNTAAITSAFPIYVPAKAAKDAGTVVSLWAGLYVEDPATGSAGTITDKIGVYSKPRIQTETGVIIGQTQATTSAAQKATRLAVVGAAAAGQPVVRITKGSGSTDDILNICDSGNQPTVIVNQAGQFVFKAGGTSHSMGSAAGPCVALGNITTPPSANYTSGAGGHLYVESGALKFRGGTGTVTTVGPA